MKQGCQSDLQYSNLIKCYRFLLNNSEKLEEESMDRKYSLEGVNLTPKLIHTLQF